LKPECSNIFLVLNEKVIDLNTRNMKGFEEQQGKVIEACEMTQMHVVKVVKETNEKWKTSREFQEQLQQLERNLCSSIGIIIPLLAYSTDLFRAVFIGFRNQEFSNCSEMIDRHFD